MIANEVLEVNLDRVSDFVHCSLDDTLISKVLRFTRATALKIPLSHMIIETLATMPSFFSAIVSLVHWKAVVESVSLIIGFLIGN